jgi:hypothetical protein
MEWNQDRREKMRLGGRRAMTGCREIILTSERPLMKRFRAAVKESTPRGRGLDSPQRGACLHFIRPWTIRKASDASIRSVLRGVKTRAPICFCRSPSHQAPLIPSLWVAACTPHNHLLMGPDRFRSGNPGRRQGFVCVDRCTHSQEYRT